VIERARGKVKSRKVWAIEQKIPEIWGLNPNFIS
jgi:hypothetical protein